MKESIRPDLRHWCRIPGWTEEEALALSLDVDPDLVKRGEIPDDKKQDYERRKFLLERARRANQGPQVVNFEPPVLFVAHEFVSWLRSNEIEYPKWLDEGLEGAGNPVVDWKARYDELAHRAPGASVDKRLQPTERRALLKILRAVATEKYDYDGDSPKSYAPSKIAADTELAGYPVDADTIRKHLKEAWSLPRDE